MPHLSGKVSAALSVVLSAATGLLTNVLTDQVSWALAAAVVGLVAAGAALAWAQAHAGHGSATTVVEQRVRGGSITDGRITASGASRVTERVRRNGRISRSTTRARDARVVRDVGDGSIEDQRTDAGG